jgi:hypothetical protein
VPPRLCRPVQKRIIDESGVESKSPARITWSGGSAATSVSTMVATATACSSRSWARRNCQDGLKWTSSTSPQVGSSIRYRATLPIHGSSASTRSVTCSSSWRTTRTGHRLAIEAPTPSSVRPIWCTTW